MQDNELADDWLSSEKLEAGTSVMPTPRKIPGKRDTSTGLSLSGGEWGKLCFARTLVKRNADLRYDLLPI